MTSILLPLREKGLCTLALSVFDKAPRGEKGGCMLLLRFYSTEPTPSLRRVPFAVWRGVDGDKRK